MMGYWVAVIAEFASSWTLNFCLMSENFWVRGLRLRSLHFLVTLVKHMPGVLVAATAAQEKSVGVRSDVPFTSVIACCIYPCVGLVETGGCCGG